MSDSHNREYGHSSKHKHSSSKWRDDTPEKTNLINFSFSNHKNFLETLIFGYQSKDIIIENLSDFWGFVAKYESMLKKSGQPILSDPIDIDKDSMKKRYLNEYHKRLCTFIEIDLNKDDIKRKIEYYHDKDITKYRVKQFFEVVILYLDFKQKEKFNKLKKLRKTQSTLPVYEYKKEILEKVVNHQVVIIAGDTGCGKSTQVPQYMNQYGFKSVACTQPRRLACVSLSKRVAYEMLCEYESKVGYQIRFEKNRNLNTEICFITEGLLLRQLALDSNFDQYDVLILDEIHERNLYGDFLLGVTKCLLKAKPDMKLILMSATINISLFANYFQDENVAVIEVPGRLYPIKTHYMPSLTSIEEVKSRSSKSDRFSPEPYIQIMRLIDQKYDIKDKGDVLMFVSGVNEISTIIDAAKEYAKENGDHWIILPLHSGLSLADQDKVFDYAPEGMRKCIVSTNIAETSLTVDGVRFVVDSGKVKEMSYDASSKTSRLKEFWVSKSSAEQRKGRAGRTGPGICYRLYSEKDYEEFESYTTPEIQRVPLESILLQMISMGLTNVRIFPFVESPPKESIERAILSLKQHEALTSDEKITALGKALSTLPVEISIGKMLLMGCVFQELQRVLTLAALLSVQSPFTSRAFKDYKCSEARKEFESDQGDVFTLLNLFKEWLEQKSRPGENTRKWCYRMGIEEQRFYEITKLRQQFCNILESCNIIEGEKEETLSSAERAIRNGEIRNLKAIKRAHKMEAPRKRKLLKREYDDDEEKQFEDDNGMEDIRDIDFRLRNDSRRMKDLIRSATVTKHRDVVILKAIIVSGFYPQIAIPDEFNYCKSGSQQFFHTFTKPFISLHPNGQFASNYELLKLSDSDIITEKAPYYTPRLSLSSVHQILCYQNLLETTKPYLLNCIRMPAASTLLLFSFTIDTNISITRIVCDTWLCLEFPTPESGQELLLKAINVRYKWKKLLLTKLEDIQLQRFDKFEQDDNPNSSTIKKGNQQNRQEYEEFWDDLINFMSLSVTYAIKRLLPGDIKDLYNHIEMNPKQFKLNPFQEDYQIVCNTEKGGLNVTENIVYGCLREEKWSIAMDEYMKEFKWECTNCGKEKSIVGISKLIHKVKCRPLIEENSSKDEKDESSNIYSISSSSSSSSKNLKKMFCEYCKRELYLTPVQILKHKKECNSNNK